MSVYAVKPSNVNSSCCIEVKSDKSSFTAKDEQTQNIPTKKYSSKDISDVLVVLSSALIIAFTLLASYRKGKNPAALKEAPKHLEEELVEENASQNKPFIQRFGCFWDNLQRNHKELTNNLIYALGLIVIEPFVILANPFGQEKSTKKDKMTAIARLPISLVSALSFQYSMDKFFNELIPRLSREGFLGEEFKSLEHNFQDLTPLNKTKLKTMKEVTIFSLGLLTLPLSVALTNTLYGKFLKYTKIADKVPETKNKKVVTKNDDASEPQEQKISFKGAGSQVAADFEPSKGLLKRFYQFISKPIKAILESNWLERKTSALGTQGVDSDIFQKLIICGIAAKDTVRMTTSMLFNYNNTDLSYGQRLYMLFYHFGIGVPSIIIDLAAGFLAIKHQDRFLEKILKKFNFSEIVHKRTKNGLKFFIPVALATIVGKRILSPAIAIPLAGVMKKKSLDKQAEENKSNAK